MHGCVHARVANLYKILVELGEWNIFRVNRWIGFIFCNWCCKIVGRQVCIYGTKGEEYDNVAIIMEKGFGRLNPEKFKKFFHHIANNSSTEANADIEDTQNLLYVSCSRAIKNLRILHLDDISEVKDGVLKIFDEIAPYQPGEAQRTG